MLQFVLQRTVEDGNSTGGYVADSEGHKLCATLERSAADREHPRILSGVYPLIIRPFGQSRFDADYRKFYGTEYRGIIQIDKVPGRTFIELHKGNWWWQTLGCVMLGLTVQKNVAKGYYEIPAGESGVGFWPAYQKIAAAIVSEGAELRVVDIQEEPLIA